MTDNEEKMENQKSTVSGISVFAACTFCHSSLSILSSAEVFFMGFYTKFDYLTDTVEAVGLDNFLYVLKDPEFVLAMKNTAVFAVISVPLGIITALVFALILNSNIRFQKFFRSAYFLPFVTSTTAVAVVWRWMLNKRLWNGQCTSLGAWDAKSSVAYRCADDHPDLDCIKCVERAWL